MTRNYKDLWVDDQIEGICGWASNILFWNAFLIGRETAEGEGVDRPSYHSFSIKWIYAYRDTALYISEDTERVFLAYGYGKEISTFRFLNQMEMEELSKEEWLKFYAKITKVIQKLFPGIRFENEFSYCQSEFHADITLRDKPMVCAKVKGKLICSRCSDHQTKLAEQERIAQERAHMTYMEKRAEERAKVTPARRFLILKRDNFRCQACGASAGEGARLHVDHIVPISLGGTSDDDNLQTLCQDCNLGKSATG